MDGLEVLTVNYQKVFFVSCQPLKIPVYYTLGPKPKIGLKLKKKRTLALHLSPRTISLWFNVGTSSFHVHDEAIVDIGFEHALPSSIDVSHWDLLNHCRHFALGAEFEHFLRFFDASDDASGQDATTKQSQSIYLSFKKNLAYEPNSWGGMVIYTSKFFSGMATITITPSTPRRER